MNVRWFCLGLGACLLGASPASLAAADEPKQKVFQVPYRLTNTAHILVRAKINGKGPFNFIVDTGAPILVVATSVGKQVGLVPDKKGWTTLERFEIEGGAVRKDMKCRVETPFQLEGMNGLGLAGVELHGMMGYALLAHYRMEIDFTRDKMTWTELEFKPLPPVGIRDKDTSALASLEFLGTLLKFLGALSGRQQDALEPRGFLGIELAEQGGAVTIKSVLPDTPAAAAGLKAGDRLERVQNRDVRNAADVHRLTARVVAGREFRLAIRRDGQNMEFVITAGEGL